MDLFLMFRMSLSASILILAIILIRACLLNRLPKRAFLVLWSVAALRLLVPYSFSSKLSIFSLLRDSNVPQISETITLITPSQVSSANPVPSPSVITDVFEATGAAATQPTLSVYEITWIVGLCIVASFFVILHVRNRRNFRTSLPLIHPLTDRWLQAHSLRRPLQIRYLDRVSVPLTYGIFKPVILLPKATDLNKESQLRYVLIHELIHIRRFDAVWKAVLAILLCLHWFNPLVWCMYVLANRDIELSCDEAVVHALGPEKKEEYALTLIDLAASHCSSAPLINHFSKNVMEERIKSIMKTKRIRLMSIIIAAVLVVGVAVFFGTSAVSSSETRKEESYIPHRYTPDEMVSFLEGSQTDAIEYYSKIKIYNSYDSALHEITTLLDSSGTELPEDLVKDIESLDQEATSLKRNYNTTLDFIKYECDVLNYAEFQAFNRETPALLEDSVVSQDRMNHHLEILNALLFDEITAMDSLPDSIKVLPIYTHRNYLIYQLSLISDVNPDSVYFTYNFVLPNVELLPGV